jgi:hypothetical protein
MRRLSGRQTQFFVSVLRLASWSLARRSGDADSRLVSQFLREPLRQDGIEAEDCRRTPGPGKTAAARCPAAESHIVPDAGHITVLDSAPEAVA